MPEDRIKSKRGNYLRPNRIIDGTKVCTGCKIRKPVKEFHNDKSQASGITSRCKKCVYIRCQKWRRGMGEKKFLAITRKSDWKKHGIIFTQEEYLDKLDSQGGCCAICKVPQIELSRRLSVDHNHKTGQIRGLLCPQCNYIVGAIESNGYRIPMAKIYLKEWRNKSE